MTQLFKSKWLNFSLDALRDKIESFWHKKLSHLSWVEIKTFKLKKKNIYCIGYATGNGQSCIIVKAVNKQNTLKLLRFKLYYKMILKMILKSFDFQCYFDFQITTSKMILILILKSSTYDDFAHLWI